MLRPRMGIRVWISVLAVGLWVSPAQAMSDSDKEAIRILSNQAAEEFKQDHFEEARAKFATAYELARVPRLAVWLARANEKLGHLVAAYELYRQAVSLQPNELWKGDLQQKAQRDAQEELDALTPRIPKLTIVLEDARADAVSVTLDDAEVPSSLVGVERMLDPGQHRIVAKRGHDEVSETVQMAEREQKQVVLKYGPAPDGTNEPSDNPKLTEGNLALGASTAPPSEGTVPNQPHPETASGSTATGSGLRRNDVLRMAGWGSLGIGASGIALGTITGIYVAVKHGDLDSKCPNNSCDPRFQLEVEHYHTMRTLSSIGFVIGGIGAAAGVTLLLTSPKQESTPNVALWILPQLAMLKGDF